LNTLAPAPTTADLLRSARSLIAKPGNWTKGSFYELREHPDGATLTGYCTVGAIDEAAFLARALRGLQAGNTDFTRLKAQLAVALVVGVDVRALPAWNDEPERTHAEVLAAFDKAIEIETQREAQP